MCALPAHEFNNQGMETAKYTLHMSTQVSIAPTRFLRACTSYSIRTSLHVIFLHVIFGRPWGWHCCLAHRFTKPRATLPRNLSHMPRAPLSVPLSY
jgi:hypothetical protein